MTRPFRTPGRLLVGAGAGAAAVLDLLRELPEHADVMVILRSTTPGELLLHDEVSGEVERRGGRLVELSGSRHWVRLDAAALCAIVPDVRRREVHVSGPDALSRRLVAELGRAGVPERRIHVESRVVAR
jgi:ferredoxin-NADP reductase